MPEYVVLSAIKTNVARWLEPVISNRNRLEGSPRTEEFQRSLRAEVRDPLWTLCRQWQFGEFQGDDAGTAYQARIAGNHQQPVSLVSANGQAAPYDIGLPLEPLVEQEPLDATLQLRAQIGRQALKMLKHYQVDQYGDLLLGRYPLTGTPHPDDKEGVYLTLALSGRLPDGYQLLLEIQSGAFQHWLDNESGAGDPGHLAKFGEMQAALLRWYGHLYQQPMAGENAWLSNHLEYNFALHLPTTEEFPAEQLVADQYHGGRLDWYAFDQNAPAASDTTKPRPRWGEPVSQTFIPMPLEFRGMPHPRYWQMEESLTDFGKIDASPTALLNLLLAEYGLTYSNDWFVLPYQLPINTLCELDGIVATDVFGFNLFIEPTVKDPEMNWREFAVFHQTERQQGIVNRSRFYLAPAVGQLLESEPVEQVNFIRDEMSNMVWGIENKVPSAAGGGRDVKRDVPRLPQDFVPADNESLIRYVLGSTVPDNWIPFIAVHKPVPAGELPREIRLQRARLPQAAGPQTKLLQEQQPVMFVEEEEVPRAGTIITRSFQRTRWLNGKTILWLGRRRTAGRGEGWSGLMFDQILPVER